MTPNGTFCFALKETIFNDTFYVGFFSSREAYQVSGFFLKSTVIPDRLDDGDHDLCVELTGCC